MAPVTIVVFRSARPTVTAMLVCPDAVKASSATTVRADAMVMSFEVEVQHNRLAVRIKAVCIKFVENNHARFFGRDWCANRPKAKLPMQSLCTHQYRRGNWWFVKEASLTYESREMITFCSIFDRRFL